MEIIASPTDFLGTNLYSRTLIQASPGRGVGFAFAGKGGGLAPAAGGLGGEPFRLERFEEGELDEAGKLDQLMDVSLDVKVVLGKTTMAIEDIIRIKSGSVVELDKLAGDPLDVLVNSRIVARGEVLVLNDNFCIRITEILSPEARVDFGEAV